ncbi:hypothetical protein CsSME_00003363 [Camellia sinensis var. sinensis]
MQKDNGFSGDPCCKIFSCLVSKQTNITLTPNVLRLVEDFFIGNAKGHINCQTRAGIGDVAHRSY